MPAPQAKTGVLQAACSLPALNLLLLLLLLLLVLLCVQSVTVSINRSPLPAQPSQIWRSLPPAPTVAAATRVCTHTQSPTCGKKAVSQLPPYKFPSLLSHTNLPPKSSPIQTLPTLNLNTRTQSVSTSPCMALHCKQQVTIRHNHQLHSACIQAFC
jgi:hypothetical protein